MGRLAVNFLVAHGLELPDIPAGSLLLPDNVPDVQLTWYFALTATDTFEILGFDSCTARLVP